MEFRLLSCAEATISSKVFVMNARRLIRGMVCLRLAAYVRAYSLTDCVLILATLVVDSCWAGHREDLRPWRTLSNSILHCTEHLEIDAGTTSHELHMHTHSKL